jgi:hypothetical protein
MDKNAQKKPASYMTSLLSKNISSHSSNFLNCGSDLFLGRKKVSDGVLCAPANKLGESANKLGGSANKLSGSANKLGGSANKLKAPEACINI